uniref:Secreted protein n=1 Tax=Arundo donax TaxID=35708 RepID=A0A0A9E8R7_ARUDO
MRSPSSVSASLILFFHFWLAYGCLGTECWAICLHDPCHDFVFCLDVSDGKQYAVACLVSGIKASWKSHMYQ